jgi:chaperonin GroEL (HSP60 family)
MPDCELHPKGVDSLANAVAVTMGPKGQQASPTVRQTMLRNNITN